MIYNNGRFTLDFNEVVGISRQNTYIINVAYRGGLSLTVDIAMYANPDEEFKKLMTSYTAFKNGSVVNEELRQLQAEIVKRGVGRWESNLEDGSPLLVLN